MFKSIAASYTIRIIKSIGLSAGEMLVMGKKGWIILLVLSLVMICISVFSGLFSNRAILRPGCHVEEGYHYFANGMRCHCIITNQLSYAIGLTDTPWLQVKNLRIINADSYSCTILYEIDGLDGTIATDNYPLSNLIYSPLILHVEPQNLFYMRMIIIVVSAIFTILSALNIDRLKRGEVEYE